MTAGALPAGLSLSSGGSISGTPTTTGTFTFTVTATDVNLCTGLQAYTVTIIAPTPTPTPTPDSPTAVPTLSEWGMIIFMVLGGLMSIYYLRRRRM
jgi:carbohydrate-binding DOMON domain-containing protein